MAETVTGGGGPLAGVKVLDMTEHMAGPFCTMILADMGAEVVKLERPGKGDSSRALGDGSARTPYFPYINRNKRVVTLDYQRPEGKALRSEEPTSELPSLMRISYAVFGLKHITS